MKFKHRLKITQENETNDPQLPEVTKTENSELRERMEIWEVIIPERRSTKIAAFCDEAH